MRNLTLCDNAASGFAAINYRDETYEIAASQRLQLRQRVRNCGGATLSDEELLELIIQQAMPQLDVKPLVYRLLKAFGNLNHVMAASEYRLNEVYGMTQSVIDHLKIMEATGHRMARVKVLDQIVLDHWSTLITYLRVSLSHLETERFRVLYLNKRNVLVADEELGIGTIDHVSVYPREVVKRALRHNASALIVVHNHPSGDPSPSPVDISMTHSIAAAAATLGLLLHDHVIIGKGSEFSFRSEGLL